MCNRRRSEIEASCAFVLFLDDKTLASKWCRAEVAHAAKLGLPIHVVVDEDRHNVAALIKHWEEGADAAKDTIAKVKGDGSHQFISYMRHRAMRRTRMM